MCTYLSIIKILKTETEDTISMVSNWFKANGFLLNDSKTQSILFCLKITQSESNTDNLKLLAVYFDQKLSWEHHIRIIKKII